jgi:Na+/pantothenate symporter
MSTGRFVLLGLFQLLSAVALSGYWFHLRTEAFLSGPGDGDLYAHTLGFQWMVYCVIYLPPTLLATGALLLVQRLWIFRRPARQSPN